MTPDFPAFAPLFARQLHHLRTTTGPALQAWEALLQDWIPRHLLAQEDQGPHSRDRLWNLRLTFWTFLWQIAHAGASCREAVREARDRCRLLNRPVPPETTSPYCQARSSLPLERLDQIHRTVLSEAQEALSAGALWCGLDVQVVDGTTLTAPDTPENQAAYPQQKVQRPGCGFPILRLVALFSLATGMIGGWVTGTWVQHELMLFQQLWEWLRPGQLLLGDRGFCTWGLLAQCQARSLHAVFRLRGTRRRDFRRGRCLGGGQRLVHWNKPPRRPRTLSVAEWITLPACLELRLVRSRLQVRGFRTTQIALVTTLLDTQRYPLEAFGLLYLRRWRMELAFRDLKITLQMDPLRCRTPNTVAREIRLHRLVHNLARRVMLEAARRHRVPPDRLSFAGTLAACRCCAQALLQTRSESKRRQLLAQLFLTIASDLVPHRPGRREPRAVKRRPKPYPRLTCHRHRFREIQHQNRYYIPAKLRPAHPKYLGLN